MLRRTRWFAPLLLVTFVSGHAFAEPRIELGDSFLPFFPGLLGYGRERGSVSSHRYYPEFGVTTVEVDPGLDTVDHDDSPDTKYRVRITLSDDDPNGNPSGDVHVSGVQYEHIPGSYNLPPILTPVSETLHFVTNGAMTTSTYFDEVTSISTTGLGIDAVMDVEWWDGHEQEMDVGVGIADIASEEECETGWLVYFNGQEAVPDWDSETSRCGASLIAGATVVDGERAPGPYRGMYFGLDVDDDENDAFHHHDLLGHTPLSTTWQSWLGQLPYRGYFFDIDLDDANDTHVRPILVQLERQSDLAIVDTARVMLTIAVGPQGLPVLKGMLPGVQNPGAIGYLTPRGLDRLEPTHAATLPYPIVAGGKQPRLSQGAIDVAPHTSDEIDVNLSDLSESSLAYWTEPNPAPEPNSGEFAGYLAYRDILAEAKVMKSAFDYLKKACSTTPNPALCEISLRTTHCVDRKPTTSDFRIRIEGIDTYFMPSRVDDALGIGDVSAMDLEFEDDQITADFRLDDIHGWLEASIDPSLVSIEWDKGLLDPCILWPSSRRLSDYVDDTDDRDGWLSCQNLEFNAASGTLGAPIAFDVRADGESIETPFAPGTPDVSLAGVTANVDSGICAEDWLHDFLESEILAWEADIEDTIAVELKTVPGEDEALDRLLAPYELGIERVDTPPPGTSPYDVHPLATYDLLASIGSTTSDAVYAHCNAADGLYVPYLTQSTPRDSNPYLFWYCPVASGQTCNGLAGAHEPMLTGGVDQLGHPFDVGVSYTTAHINQALWAQARRPDRLGSQNERARLVVEPDAIGELADLMGHTDVADALDAIGTDFGVRFHHDGAPFIVLTDGSEETRLIYVTPNLVVELVSLDAESNETVVAKFLVDVIDQDFQLRLARGGDSALDAAWGNVDVFSTTSTFLPSCFDERGAESCDGHLRQIVGSLLWPELQARLLDMIARMPALQLFDAAGESGRPRHIGNARTVLANQEVLLLGDLCVPGAPGCG
ncbi:MAG: hypothetical protein JNL21_27735 [Myxococcales bacterium]|nr:hypothetical protein [Myxococcales bacterium]